MLRLHRVEGRVIVRGAGRTGAKNSGRKTHRGIVKLVRLRFGLPHARRGDAARLRNDWIEAVVSYRRALDWLPWREDLQIQVGNCLKEFGDLNGAIAAYRSVSSPAHRPEALRQMADANQRDGFTVHPYRIDNTADGAHFDDNLIGSVDARLLPNRLKLNDIDPRRRLGPLGNRSGPPRRSSGNAIGIKLDQVGAMSIERDGVLEPLLAGIIAVRGRLLSLRHIETLSISLGEGECAQIIETVPTHLVSLDGPLMLQVFNAWIDSARLPSGRHWLSVNSPSRSDSAGLFVNIGEFAHQELLASSNAFVPSPADGTTDCDEFVNTIPTVARPAARTLFDGEINSLLIIRADQLGDLSASMPAFARLRALFPKARISALVQPSVQAIVEASGIVDEVLTVELPYDHRTERRYLDDAEERRISNLFNDRALDLAIDLSPGDETRPLLLLAGATYLVGFNPERFTFLDFGISIRSRDKLNQLEKNSHAVNVLALVETLALVMTPDRAPVERKLVSGPVLAANGLVARRYIVLHTGARHAINKWPIASFLALAEELLRRTDLDIVLFFDEGDDPEQQWSPEASHRVHRFSRTDTDSFDAILSNAALMIANDSGPKHLAAMRGVLTVSLQVGRLNWNEWGQDGIGKILSKRVPCTGCGLNDIEMCGRGAICITAISVDDVLNAIAYYISID
ncbi:glycosyltransferase family 9 protein [Sphingobium amiense]|uniref:glycosyltransferase family 9 protein n=1 Tax=Sphingobium amiense TaxID=135719 RepID=UPI000A060A5D|nr:glycosyltransferase family 9 protein [Sphingobium amiense]